MRWMASDILRRPGGARRWFAAFMAGNVTHAGKAGFRVLDVRGGVSREPARSFSKTTVSTAMIDPKLRKQFVVGKINHCHPLEHSAVL